MTKRKLEVTFSRVYEVEAETWNDCENVAKEKAMKELTEQNLFNVLRTEEYKEPTNWHREAEELGHSIATDIEKEIKKVVSDWKAKNPSGVIEIENGVQVADNTDEVSKEIFDELYQSEDISERAWEYADGYFIYNSTDALRNAMDCMDSLSEYDSGDSGIWEGKTDYWDIINIQATDALRGAIYHFAEEAVKEKIAELLQ